MRSRRSLLPWIVAFKAVKSATLVGLGVTLLATRHSDPLDLVVRLALAVHVPLTSAAFERALRFATGLTVRRHTALGVTALGYAALMGAEGLGLALRRAWARWFTIIATSSLVPIELFEIGRGPTLARITIVALNVGVVAYLVRRRDMFEG
jgi:uncharacterized membrane protein (DUF2068 family)